MPIDPSAKVCVIGAGPAGSLAALLIARAGIDVTLIEQQRFPRDKVCGECLSALGIEVLEEAGLADVVRAASAITLTQTAMHPPDGPPLVLKLPRPMWGISRNRLDPLLLSAARSAGARIHQPVRCEKIGAGQVTVRDLESNELRELRAFHVLLADGKGALLSRKPTATKDLGLKTHFTGAQAPSDTIELFGVTGHYVGSAPIEPAEEFPNDSRWNVAFSVPAARVHAHRGDLDALWQSLLEENPALSDRYVSAQRTGPWLASPLPRFAVARTWPPGVIPLGNAAAALEPIGGEGMGLALESARLAAAELIASIRQRRPTNINLLRSQYNQLWSTRRTACRGLAIVLSSPTLSSPALELARANNCLSQSALRLIGKAD